MHDILILTFESGGLMKNRASGLLLPISALPSGWGMGSFGSQAYDFVDYLASARQTYWQILPLGPTGVGDSPYQTFSSYAFSPYYIDVDILQEEGLLTSSELIAYDCSTENANIDYSLMYSKRIPLLRLAAKKYNKELLLAFANKHAWADDFALFMSIKDASGGLPWYHWDEDLRFRKASALEAFRRSHKDNYYFWVFTQLQAWQQWKNLRAYAAELGIYFIGDLPFYVAHDSVDVWKDPKFYLLDKEGKLLREAGYPPDAFSDDGQLWGNPIFNWKALKKARYAPWISRLSHHLKMYDYVRLDHFLGFVNYWSIPAGSHPSKGRWEKGPGYELFAYAREALGELNLIAEDLGLISPEVIRLRKDLNIPGMRVLQFAFDPHSDNEHLPHNYELDNVVYTGTHDNDTFAGWWEHAGSESRQFTKKYLRLEDGGEPVQKTAHLTLMASIARTCILPVQDLLGIGREGRINIPNTLSGNWIWRMSEIPDSQSAAELAEWTIIYRRTPLESV